MDMEVKNATQEERCCRAGCFLSRWSSAFRFRPASWGPIYTLYIEDIDIAVAVLPFVSHPDQTC